MLQVGVFRVRGADSIRLLAVWVSGQQAALQNRLQVSETEVAGHHVTHLVDPRRVDGGSTYAYAVADTIYIVFAADDAVLEEVLAGLPT